MPAYIRNANRHIMLLKNTFEMHNLSMEYLLESFDKGALKMTWAKEGPLKEKIQSLFSVLANGAQRAGISVKELVARAEHAPVDVKYSDYADIGDIMQQQNQRLQSAIIIESLKKLMTPEEIRVCEGIMEDKTYEEIAEEFGHKAPWVHQQLVKIREKLKGEQ